MVIAAIVAEMLAGIPGWRLARSRPWTVAGIVACAAAMAFCLELVNVPIWNDEMEHLHAAWLMLIGKAPFRDFWQHHPPALWLALEPLVWLLPKTVAMVWGLRVVSLTLVALSIVGAGLWARNVLAPRVSLMRALICAALLSGCVSAAQLGPVVRAETLAGALLVAAMALGWRGLTAPSRAATLLAGICCGAACVLTPKFVPLAVAWPLGVLLGARRTRLTDTAPPRALLWWLLGCLAPVAVQVAWLVKHDILEQCLYWCFSFNEPQWSLARAGYLLALLGALTPLIAMWALGLRRLRAQMPGPLPTLMATLAAGGFLGLAAAPVYWAYSAWGMVLVMLPVATLGLHDVLDNASQSAKPGRLMIGPRLLALALMPLLIWGCVAFNVQFSLSYGFGAFVTKAPVLQKIMALGRDRAVLCIIPEHPIFCEDATPLWHPWQLYKGQEPDSPLLEVVITAAHSLAAGRPEFVGARAADAILELAGDPQAQKQWEAHKALHYRPALDGRVLIREIP